MHITTQVSTAVRPSDFGACSVTELKMLTNTRKRVTKRAIRPRKKSNKYYSVRLVLLVTGNTNLLIYDIQFSIVDRALHLLLL